FNLGFGPQPGNLIRDRVRNAACILSFSGPDVLCSSGDFTISNDVVEQWNVSNGFGITFSDATSATVTVIACPPTGQTGELTATLSGGGTIILPIQACNWTNMTISGPDEIVAVPGLKVFGFVPPQYEITNLPSGATVSWQVGSVLTNCSPLNSNPICLELNVNNDYCGVALLRATVKFDENCSTTFGKEIIVGYAPDADFISSRRYMDTVPWGQGICFFTDTLTYKNIIPNGLNLLDEISQGEWRKHSSNEVFFNNPSVFTYLGIISCPLQIWQFPNNNVARIEASLKNNCGWSRWKTIEYRPGRHCPIIKIVYSPNPVNDELTIDFEELPDTDQPEEYTVKLLDNFGNVPRQTRFRHRHRDGKPRPVKFNTYSLPPGTYFLHVEGAGELVREQIVVIR
ncbi:MAG: T9SS type A sorting domain-containing protein, partial [Bacteroidales bacterium]|nr:T9SS type A sorting domain-containing protein [Bacteroidales bacterium]